MHPLGHLAEASHRRRQHRVIIRVRIASCKAEGESRYHERLVEAIRERLEDLSLGLLDEIAYRLGVNPERQ